MSKTKILEDFHHYLLPEDLLDFFEDEVYKRDLHLYFDERDNRTPELQHLQNLRSINKSPTDYCR